MTVIRLAVHRRIVSRAENDLGFITRGES